MMMNQSQISRVGDYLEGVSADLLHILADTGNALIVAELAKNERLVRELRSRDPLCTICNLLPYGACDYHCNLARQAAHAEGGTLV